MKSLKKLFLFILIYAVFLAVLALFLNYVIRVDENLFSLIFGFSNPFLETFFNIITNFGSSAFWILVIIWFWLKGKKEITLRLLFVFVLDVITVTILKWTFLRPRPIPSLQTGIDIDVGPSFPSGHSQMAFSGAVVLSHYYEKYSALFYLLSVLTALSRIFLGLHFPLDVLIGAVNGIIIGFGVLLIPKKKFNSQKLFQLSD